MKILPVMLQWFPVFQLIKYPLFVMAGFVECFQFCATQFRLLIELVIKVASGVFSSSDNLMVSGCLEFNRFWFVNVQCTLFSFCYLWLIARRALQSFLICIYLFGQLTQKLQVYFLRCGLDGTLLCGIAVLRYSRYQFTFLLCCGKFLTLDTITLSSVQNFSLSNWSASCHIMHLTRTTILDNILWDILNSFICCSPSH